MSEEKEMTWDECMEEVSNGNAAKKASLDHALEMVKAFDCDIDSLENMDYNSKMNKFLISKGIDPKKENEKTLVELKRMKQGFIDRVNELKKPNKKHSPEA